MSLPKLSKNTAVNSPQKSTQKIFTHNRVTNLTWANVVRCRTRLGVRREELSATIYPNRDSAPASSRLHCGDPLHMLHNTLPHCRCSHRSYFIQMTNNNFQRTNKQSEGIGRILSLFMMRMSMGEAPSPMPSANAVTACQKPKLAVQATSCILPYLGIFHRLSAG